MSSFATVTDLAELTGELPFVITRIFEEYSGRTFISVTSRHYPLAPKPEKGFMLGHADIQEQVLFQFVGKNKPRYLQMLHDWCEGYHTQKWPYETPNYLLTDYLSLLYFNSDWNTLSDYLCEEAFVDCVNRKHLPASVYLKLINDTAKHLSEQAEPDLYRLSLLSVVKAHFESHGKNIPEFIPPLIARLGHYDYALELSSTISSSNGNETILNCWAEIAMAMAKNGDHDRALRLVFDVVDERIKNHNPWYHDKCIPLCAEALSLSDNKDKISEIYNRVWDSIRATEGHNKMHGEEESELIKQQAKAGDIEGALHEARRIPIKHSRRARAIIEIAIVQAYKGGIINAKKTVDKALACENQGYSDVYSHAFEALSLCGATDELQALVQAHPGVATGWNGYESTIRASVYNGQYPSAISTIADYKRALINHAEKEKTEILAEKAEGKSFTDYRSNEYYGYNNIQHNYWKIAVLQIEAGDIDGAGKTIYEIKAFQLREDARTYYWIHHIIGLLLSRGDTENARAILELELATGLNPKAYGFEAVIGDIARVFGWQKALDILKESTEQFDSKYENAILLGFGEVISGCLDTEDTKTAEVLLQAMFRFLISVNSDVFSYCDTIPQTLLLIDEFKEAEKFTGLNPSVDGYILLAEYDAKHNETNRAYEFLSLAKELVPDTLELDQHRSGAYLAIAKKLLEFGNAPQAKAVIKKAYDLHPEIKIKSSGLLVRAYGSSGYESLYVEDIVELSVMQISLGDVSGASETLKGFGLNIRMCVRKESFKLLYAQTFCNGIDSTFVYLNALNELSDKSAANAWVWVAKACIALNEMEKANEAVTKSFYFILRASGFSYEDCHNTVADTLIELGRTKDAERLIRYFEEHHREYSSHSANDDAFEAFINLACYCIKQGNSEKADHYCREAEKRMQIESVYNLERNMLKLIDANIKAGMLDDAKAMVESMLEYFPTNKYLDIEKIIPYFPHMKTLGYQYRDMLKVLNYGKANMETDAHKKIEALLMLNEEYLGELPIHQEICSVSEELKRHVRFANHSDNMRHWAVWSRETQQLLAVAQEIVDVDIKKACIEKLLNAPWTVVAVLLSHIDKEVFLRVVNKHYDCCVQHSHKNKREGDDAERTRARMGLAKRLVEVRINEQRTE